MIIWFLLLLSYRSPLWAQVGCIGQNIPLQINGTMYTSRASGGYFELYGARDVNPYANYCVTPTGGSCVIKGLASYQGTEVTYGPLPCPIDTDMAVLLLAGVAYGSFRIRKTRIQSKSPI